MVSGDGYTMDPADVAQLQALKERILTTVGDVRKCCDSSLISEHTSQISPGLQSHFTSYSHLLLNKQRIGGPREKVSPEKVKVICHLTPP